MRFLLRALLVLVLAVLIAAGLLLFTPLGDEPLAALFPAGDPEPVAFETLAPAETPNRHLVCPPGLCGARPDRESPVFDVPAEELRARWDAMIEARPRVTLLERDEAGLQDIYLQRSAVFRFPDLIDVRFIALPEGRATLAVYSRSLFGRNDFGVNAERVEAWLRALRSDGRS